MDVVESVGGRSYPEVVQGADKYIVGAPGRPFYVQVTAPLAIFRSAPTLRVYLTIDGRDVGVWKLLNDKRPSCTFEGFLNTVKGEHRSSQFLFGKPQDASEISGASSSLDPRTGRFEVVIDHVHPNGFQTPQQHVSSSAAIPSKADTGVQFHKPLASDSCLC